MDKFNLERFVKAQENQMYTYRDAFEEISSGRKRTHWIWYVFPQLKFLGRSDYALYYGISGLEEAKAYIEHPVLGKRLREISAVLLTLDTDDALSVMGSPDNRKLLSCMTLFAHAAEDNEVFLKVLEKYFGGRQDGRTLGYLESVANKE